jgi:hypothetical protein
MSEHLHDIANLAVVVALVFFGARAALMSHLAEFNRKPGLSIGERLSPLNLLSSHTYTEKGNVYRRKCLLNTALTLVAAAVWKLVQS